MRRPWALPLVPLYAAGLALKDAWLDRGHGVRAPVVFYNRSNEAAAQLKPGDFDWAKIFAGGVKWFHSGGIFAALSETTAEVIIEGMKAAKAAGVTRVVFDRGGFLFHGRVKALAEAAREAGLEF